jgi:type I restriction enzyme S subunit
VTEQRKIAQILSTWDEAIALVEALIAALKRRKQGLMQRLLTGAVRFPGFEDEWQEIRLGEVFERVTRKNTIGNDNVLTASGLHGLVSQADYFNRRVASESVENYYLIERGEFAYNRSYSDGYPFGAIKRLEEYDAGVLSTLYLCFRLANEAGVGEFYKHFFEAGGMNRGIYQIAQEGARNHGLLNVGTGDFFNLEIPFPSTDEQQKLADFFNDYDELIEATTQYAENLREQKRGLMQRLLTGEVRVRVE